MKLVDEEYMTSVLETATASTPVEWLEAEFERVWNKYGQIFHTKTGLKHWLVANVSRSLDEHGQPRDRHIRYIFSIKDSDGNMVWE